MNSLHRVFFKNFSFFKTYTINIILNIYDLCVSLYISFFKYKYDIFVKKSLSIKFKNLFNIQEGCVDLSLIKIVFGKIINKTLFKSLIWGNRVPNGSDYKYGFVVFYKHYTQFIYECLVGVVLYEWVYAVLIEDILHIKTHILERSFNIFYFFNKFFFHSLVSFYKFLRNLIIPLFLSLLVTILLINFYAVNIVRQVGVWVVVGGIFFWLISGFNFFIKRYRFGKFTSSIQRFWKRANSYFWLVEGFLFSLFFYYYLNSSQEPIYMYDESALNQTSLFSLYNFFFSYLLLVFIIFYSLYLLLNIVNFNSKQLIFHLTVNSLLILVIYLLESYQFYFVITTFIENNWVFSGVENWWSLEIETTKTRVKYQYLLLALIAKYWHFLFIFLSWLFFVFKSYEQKRVYYPFLGVNIQNFILLFGLNSLFYFQWVKWVVRRYLDGLYYWFFIDSNNWSLYNIFTIVYNFFNFMSETFTINCKNSINRLINFTFEFISVTRQLVKKYLYTINHKRLGLNYFYFSLITGMSGAVLASAIRLEMAYPGSPFFGGDSLKYLQVITAHALIMVFFVVVPIFFGGFANFLLPYHVGSKDVAFPRLNSLGFWIQPCGYLLIAKIGFIRTACWTNFDKTVNYFNLRESDHFSKVIVSNPITTSDNNILEEFIEEAVLNSNKHVNYQLEVSNTLTNKSTLSWKLFFWKYIHIIPDSFWFLVTNAKYYKRKKRHVVKCASATQTVSGWTFITPFSSKIKYTGVGVQDMLILGVYYAGISTTISLVNLLATRRVLSIPGLRNRRILLPFISITILLMLRALAVITPVLGSAMLMLALDRHWQTSFFDFAYGGDPVFFHHLFWFFGHPEVYVLVIPAFGVINSVIPAVNFRRVASKHHLIWAIYIMNYMGFIVWGHHMYLIGLDHRSRALYSTVTIMISMPATIKVVNWTFTLVNGALKNDLIFLSVISFILFFLVAGFTGMWLSHVSLNISMHDTLYVVAHFHLMLSGAVVMGIFVGFYFYFTVFFQNKFSRTFGFIHIILYTGGQWLTFIPLFWVSFSGLPRRLHDFPAIYMGWQGMATSGHFITMLGVCSFYLMILDSKIEKKMISVLSSLVPRLNKRAIYYLGKLIYFTIQTKNLSYRIPTKRVVNVIIWCEFF